MAGAVLVNCSIGLAATGENGESSGSAGRNQGVHLQLDANLVPDGHAEPVPTPVRHRRQP